MIKRKVPFLLFVCAIGVALEGCSGAPSAWDGKWRLNELKSNYIGPTFSITISPGGDYRIDNEGFGYSLRCDGKEYPTGSGHTTSCDQINPLTITLSGKTNGASPTLTEWEVSKDGSTLTTRSNKVQPDGTSKSVERAYGRVTGSIGFAGRWKYANPSDYQPKMLVLALNHGVLHLEYPEIGQYSDCPVNGVGAAIHGPEVPPGTTYSVKIRDPHQFQTAKGFAGKVVRVSNLRLSDDEQTLFAESWTPEHPDERDLRVYEKQ
jgi:hypothetical protein